MSHPVPDRATDASNATLRDWLRELYHGDTQRAVRFRTGMLIFDATIITIFIVSPFMTRSPYFMIVDYTIGSALALDLTARAWAYTSLRAWIVRPIVWVDFLVLVSLLAPMAFANLGFLRVLRGATLVRSNIFWMTIGGGRWADSRTQDIVIASTNLVVFVFVMTGFVHSTLAADTPTLKSYLNSLYFTISSLTTTGYGDITLVGTWGRILSIVIMLSGVSLFVRLGQVALRPPKVVFPCPGCGLRRHDTDAVHCKACGERLAIPHDND
jgi:voltage-gated potassium channel